MNPSCGSDVVINGTAFRMDEPIIQGSDSRIFVAHSLQGGGDPAFVIKCYGCLRDSGTWKKAMREIEAGDMLRKCPYIVRLHGCSVVRNAGEEIYRISLLFDRLQCLDNMKITDTRTALEMCRDIARALEFLRKNGLVHGDVKPQNIYCDGEKWLLGDLGSVCVSGEVPEYGSEGYLSPEAMRQERCDICSDIYSLGITMYKILSGGRLPFCPVACEEMEGSDVYSAIERRMNGEEIPPLQGVCNEVNDFVMKMCRFDKHKRYRKPCYIADAAQKLLSGAF